MFPPGWQALVSIALTIGAIIAVFAALFGVTTVIERKMIG